MIIGDPKNNPPQQVESFVGQIVVLNKPGKIKKGYSPVFHFHTAMISCRFNRLISATDRKTGQKTESPEIILENQGADIELVPIKPCVIEPFNEYPSLGRFAIRDNGKTFAVGIVKSVKKKVAK